MDTMIEALESAPFDQPKLAAMQARKAEIQRQVGHLNDIETYSGTITNGAKKIVEKVETMRKGLERQVEILKEQVGQLKSVLGDAQPG